MSFEEIHNPQIDLAHPVPAGATLPSRLLYATSSGIGGIGLDSSAIEGILASYRHGFLGRAIGYRNRQDRVPSRLIRSLRFHPVRLASSLERQRYYGAKKRYADWIASRALRRGNYDLFHGWSGDSERSLIAARRRDIPSMIEIPTWHRDRGESKPFETLSDRELRLSRGLHGVLDRLAVNRPRILLEYELADLLLVQSRRSAESFLQVGCNPKKIFYVARGVDPDLYTEAVPPPLFRLIFVGALIKRKGVHLILEAWHKLNLKNAELVLVGNIHDEMQPYLRQFKTESVRLEGFAPDVRKFLRESSAFVFPSELEGTAKATIEASACALPQITTRESGDAVVDGITGLVVPSNDADALAGAIKHLYEHPELLPDMARAARRRVLDHFTWDHYRARLIHAYAYLMGNS